jgi:hypothetical protein
MAETVRFLKPMDLRATVRGLAIMSALFDKPPECRFWTDAGIPADLATWSDPAGNACYFLFAEQGSVMLGCDPESPMSPRTHAKGSEEFRPWPGVFDELPQDLHALLERRPFRKEFNLAEATFCIWNPSQKFMWSKGTIQYPVREFGDPDGSDQLLGRFRDYFDSFEDEMTERYKRTFDPDLLFKVFADEPLTPDDLRHLKPDWNTPIIREALKEIGVAS